jgi:hypothetical protein
VKRRVIFMVGRGVFGEEVEERRSENESEAARRAPHEAGEGASSSRTATTRGEQVGAAPGPHVGAGRLANHNIWWSRKNSAKSEVGSYPQVPTLQLGGSIKSPNGAETTGSA